MEIDISDADNTARYNFTIGLEPYLIRERE
jgi:hypothetical protein